MRKSLNIAILTGLVSFLALSGCGPDASQTRATTGQVTTSTETSPIEDLSHLRTAYVGAAHATHSIVSALPLPGESWTVCSIEIGANHSDFSVRYNPYTLTVFYEPRQSSVIPGSRDMPEIPTDTFAANSDALFDLIENLQAVTFS